MANSPMTQSWPMMQPPLTIAWAPMSTLTLTTELVAMGHEVTAGDLFVFVGKGRRRAKVLWFDGTGLCLLAKRLEKGRFVALWEKSELTSSELTLFLEGSEAVGRVELSPPAFDVERDGRATFSS